MILAVALLSPVKTVHAAAYSDKEARAGLVVRLKDLLTAVSLSQAQMKYNQKTFRLLAPYRGILDDKRTQIRDLNTLIHKYDRQKKDKDEQTSPVANAPQLSEAQHLKSALYNDCKAELRLISLIDDIIYEYYDLTTDYVLAKIRNESLNHYRLLAEEIYILSRSHRNPKAAK